MMTAKEAAQFKQWTAGLPEADLDNTDSLISMNRRNKAYEDLCRKLAMILMLGNSELRTAAVTNLVLSEDSALCGSSIDFHQPPSERRKSARRKAGAA